MHTVANGYRQGFFTNIIEYNREGVDTIVIAC